MRSTRCCPMAEQVRRNANRITRFRESSSRIRRVRRAQVYATYFVSCLRVIVKIQGRIIFI